MELKVVRYKNYGCVMKSEENDSQYDHKFYFSFYELNNGEIFSSNFTENLKNDKVSSTDLHVTYAKSELKNGKIIKYKFGNAEPSTKEMSKEFFDWFDSLPPVKDLKNNFIPHENEEKCIKEFFIKKILNSKEIPTNVILL
tara:strand:+ start:6443 stop:6865 length:423 start_codon:yes stop_codon:yes gene_type:complete